jgi:ketosteroid isomerase-like protein
MIGIIRAVAVDFEQHPLTSPELLIEGAKVAGRRRVRWRHRGTGRVGVSELADFLRFEDGRIVEVVEFRDSLSLHYMQD